MEPDNQVTDANQLPCPTQDQTQKTFLAIYRAQLISSAGDALTDIAIVYWAMSVTGQPMPALMLLAVRMMGTILVGMLGGALVDTYPQRRLMIVSDVGRAALVLSLLFITTSSFWLTYPIVFLTAVLGAIFHPARESVLVRLYPPENQQLAAARVANVAKIQSMLSVIGLIGPGVAGLLVGFVHIKVAFVLDALSFVTSALILVSGLRDVAQTVQAMESNQQDRSYLHRVLDGFDHMLNDNKDLRRLTGLRVSLAAALAAYQAVIYAVLFASAASIQRQIPLLTLPVLLGLISSFQALGAFFATTWIKAHTESMMKHEMIGLPVLLLWIGAFLVLCASMLPMRPLSMIVVMFLGTIATGIGLVLVRTRIILWGQKITAPAYMGRSIAAGDAASRLSTVVSAASIGLVGSLDRVAWSFSGLQLTGVHMVGMATVLLFGATAILGPRNE